MAKSKLAQTETTIGQELARLLRFDSRIAHLERQQIELSREISDCFGDCMPTQIGPDAVMFRVYSDDGPRHIVATVRSATPEEDAQWGDTVPDV